MGLMSVGEAVVVVPYDPRWPDLYEGARAKLAAVLGNAAVAIEHIGSTAVPGLAGKPIIDIMVGVRSLEDDQPLIDALVGLGYEYVAETNPPMPFRRFFRRRDVRLAPGFPRAGYHVHMVERTHEFWATHLAFRDHLRAHPEDAAAYERLKRELAERFRSERERYTDAKGDFIAAVLAKAGL
jgi:GrpB-like predicted nucleotidyltransferase (UPF0157 family)